MRNRTLITAVAAVLTLVGCTQVTPPTVRESRTVSAVFSNIAETKSLDPHLAFSSESVLFVRQTYDSLLEYQPGGTQTRPALATKWESSADAKTHTITLRSGVRFHDGSTLDSAVVKASVDRLREINQGPATLFGNLDTVETPTADTVVFKLKNADAFFPGMLPKLPIVSKKAIDEHKTADDPWAKDWFAGNEAGSGPYTLGSWERGKAITLNAFDGYWQKFQDGTPTKVTLRTDPDVTTAVQLMCQGQVDMIGGIGTDQTDQAAACADVKAVEQPKLGVNTVFFNLKAKGPVSDVRVRKAIALAVDYKAYLEYFKGRAQEARGPLPPGAVEFEPPFPAFAQNLEEARRLLADAGYPDGGFTLSYLGLKGLAWEEFFGTLLEENLKPLGIKVKQTLVAWPQMVSVQGNPETAHDLSFLVLNMVTPDPTSILRNYTTAAAADKGGMNWGYYANGDLDQRLGQISGILDETQRLTVLREAQQSIIDDQVAIWLPSSNIYQPVGKKWEVSYEPIDFVVMVRFFYARES
ncbi:ABC transporter substrate-binding protein [Acrocarpospora catenulata]|uniref:ABC transporter substrate-binding protein n=1 Tax=Acrocarpospora catenulata TaxID=2836182 RepID=UPI001BDA1543|nr:ABC transporter substrate-binding protein [Acrocarpospora catenulata]